MPDFSPAQIRSVYIQKCNDPAFPNNLRKPTDARLKKECLILFKQKNSLIDKQILRNFLQLSDDVDLVLALKKAVPDKFKSVVHFLKGKTKDPREETIELVAWLIEFKFENYDDEPSVEVENEQQSHENELAGKELGSKEDVSISKEDEKLDPNISTTPNLINETDKKDLIEIPTISTKHTQNEQSKSSLNIYVLVAISIAFLGLGAGGFLFWQNKIDQKTISNNEKCMFWNRERFEAIVCDNDASSKAIPLDLKRLNTLIRITEPDTLTKYSMGKVWYAKINGKPEFYTASGLHPTHPDKKLNPISTYILNKYVSYYRYLFRVALKLISITLLIILIGLAYKHWWFKKSSLT